MTELEKLKERLFPGLINFHVDWGPEAIHMTIEERAKVLNDVLDNPGEEVTEWGDSNVPVVDVRDFIKEL